MKKKEYLNQCKYFHGESEYPKERLKNADLGFLIWEAEEFGYRSIGTSKEKDIIKNWRDANLPACASNMHPLLIASLFSVYAKNSDKPLDQVASEFEKIFFPNYMALMVM